MEIYDLMTLGYIEQVKADHEKVNEYLHKSVCGNCSKYGCNEAYEGECTESNTHVDWNSVCEEWTPKVLRRKKYGV